MTKPALGQALVEFALVAPIVLLVFFGVIEFGRFIYAYEMLNSATREGARYAIVHGSASLCPSGPMPGGATNPCDPTGSNVEATVRDYASEVLSATALTVDAPIWSPNNNGRGSTVTVSATYLFQPMVAIVPLTTITMHAESTLVVNH